MILDKLLLFSSAQAVTVTTPSTDVIDLQNARDLGIGDDPALKVFVQVVTAFAGAGSIQVAFQGSTDSVTWTTYALSNSTAYTAGQLTAGARLFDIDWPRPPAGVPRPRYIRLQYTNGGAAFTAGTITAGIVLDRDDNVYYPAGTVVVN